MRCFAFNKNSDKRVTYSKKVGEKLDDLGSGIVNVPPVVGRHAGWSILWRPVVEEVGQLLGRPSCAVERLAEGGGKHWVRQQNLVEKGRRFNYISSEKSLMTSVSVGAVCNKQMNIDIF